MRRARGVLLLALFVCLLSPATALGVDGDGETTFTVPLQANHGLSVKFEAGDDEIELVVSKKGQRAVYSAVGEVSAERVAVKFGQLGEFVADYEPFRTVATHGPNRHCKGDPKTTTEGYFRGVIRFRGEDGYVLIEASRVKGTLVLMPPWECDYRRTAGASRAGESEAEEDEAMLVARSRRNPIVFAVLGSRSEDERPHSAFIVQSVERKEGVFIARYTFASSRLGFRFDHRRGSAFVDPPAPFAGSARFLRRPNAPDSWRGSLTVPLLGLGRVRLAGPGFEARMTSRLPELE